MSRIEIEFQNQLKENINVHEEMLKISKDIINVIKNVKKN